MSSGNSSNFGGRDKSRGIKHQKDKTKYKGKSVKDPKHVPPKSKPNLGSNWDRYETGEDSLTPQLTSSTDFSILASVPIALGQHFQFKQDKILAEEVDSTPKGLFSLDLNMLKQSILTIPFYERMGIDKNYFTENQIRSMNRNAEDSLVNYNEKYNSNKINEPVELLNNDGDSIEIKNVDVVDIPLSKTGIKEDATVEPQAKTDDLVKPEPKDGKTETFEEDLEEWLDEILDD